MSLFPLPMLTPASSFFSFSFSTHFFLLFLLNHPLPPLLSSQFRFDHPLPHHVGSLLLLRLQPLHLFLQLLSSPQLFFFTRSSFFALGLQSSFPFFSSLSFGVLSSFFLFLRGQSFGLLTRLPLSFSSCSKLCQLLLPLFLFNPRLLLLSCSSFLLFPTLFLLLYLTLPLLF